MVRRPPVLLVLLFVAACDAGIPPTALEAPDPSFALIDGSTGGNSHFFLLPPVVKGHPRPTAPFDASLRPRVEICEWTGDACAAGPPAFTFTTVSGDVRVSGDHYKVNWDTKGDGIEPGMVFRATVFIVNLELGSVDIEIGRTGRDVKNINTGENVGLVDGRTIPIKFRIEEGAVVEVEEQSEAECRDDLGNVIDCDVVVIPGEEGGTAKVFQDPGGDEETPAAIVTIPADDVVDDEGNPVSDFVLTVEHVEEAPAVQQDIPLPQQLPFFIQATAVDGAGNPVFFQTGAELTICQPPDLGDPGAALHIPDELHHFLKIFEVHQGVTTILPTTLDNQANCPGGLHGGLNTIRLTKFSGFGATLPTLPSASTAVVPDGVVGDMTAIDIQAGLAPNTLQIFGGDDVVVTVSGANDAVPPVIDNGDGTYTAYYTPTAVGTDAIAISIRNVETGVFEPISGSPFTSEVTGADLVVASFTHSPAAPTTARVITFTALVRNDGSAVAGPSDLELRVGGETFPPTFPVPALAPGETFEVVRQLTLSVAQGYLTQATADANDAVVETNEANNEANETFVVTDAQIFATQQGTLLQVSASTGIGTVVGSTGFNSTPSLAADPLTGQLYIGQGSGQPNLYTVDHTTGGTTLVGATGLGFAAIGSLEFLFDGVLYAAVNIAGNGGTGSDHLATIDPTTGLATVIGSFGTCTGVPALPVDGTGSCTLEGMEGIAFDGNGTLYGSLGARGAAGAPGLYTIDTSTGAATFVAAFDDGSGSPPSGGVVSLEFAPDGTMFGGTATAMGGAADGGFLITINPNTGFFSTVGASAATTNGRSLTGLAIR